MLISDSDSSTRNASRSVGRDTANSAISSASAGSASPSVSSPRTIRRRSSSATSSAILGIRTPSAFLEVLAADGLGHAGGPLDALDLHGHPKQQLRRRGVQRLRVE